MTSSSAPSLWRVSKDAFSEVASASTRPGELEREPHHGQRKERAQNHAGAADVNACPFERYHQRGPEEIRKALYAFAGIEHQAVTEDRVLGVAEGDVRVVDGIAAKGVPVKEAVGEQEEYGGDQTFIGRAVGFHSDSSRPDMASISSDHACACSDSLLLIKYIFTAAGPVQGGWDKAAQDVCRRFALQRARAGYGPGSQAEAGRARTRP